MQKTLNGNDFLIIDLYYKSWQNIDFYNCEFKNPDIISIFSLPYKRKLKAVKYNDKLIYKIKGNICIKNLSLVIPIPEITVREKYKKQLKIRLRSDYHHIYTKSAQIKYKND